MRFGKLTLAAFATATLLAGCMGNDVERAAVGAAVGGVGSAAVGGSMATGALVGAAAGALADDVERALR